MKKILLLPILFFLIGTSSLSAQCVYTCGNYAVSAITYSTFPTGATNITPTFTNPVLGTFADDGSIGPIQIGFNFDYYCNTYSAVHICSNGFIMLDYTSFPWPTQYVHPTQNIASTTLPNGMIAFNMTDLDPGQGGTITYTTVGVSPNRMFIVTYSNVPCFSTPSDVNTGQIVLYETTNMIEIHTGSAKPDINQGTLGSTQGIEDILGMNAVPAPGRNANALWGSSAASTAYKFGPYTPTPPTAITGSTMLCQGTYDLYQATFMSGSTSYSWALPAGWIGTSSLTSITPTVGSSGNVSVTATYSCGTSAATTISVTINPAPVVSIVSLTPNIICSGKTITITANGATAYTLDPGFITGTSPLLDTPLTNTTYTLTGVNALGCVSFNNPTSSVLVKTTPSITVNSGSLCLGGVFNVAPLGATNYTYYNASIFGTITPTLAGNYTFSVVGAYTGTNTCVSDPVTGTVTAFANPTVTASASRTIMCAKESVSITAGGASTYSWSNQKTGNSFTVSLLTNTFFVVTGTDANGCANAATVNITVKPCTGIEDINASDLYFDVYPNPNNGEFEIKVTSVNENTTVELFNSLGQIILEKKINSEIMTIDVTSLSNGVYYLRMKNSQSQQLRKIIKE